MSERFEELLFKGRTGNLTPDEREELARSLNSPILDPLIHPPDVFVSKNTFAPSDVADRVRRIDWFSNCGNSMSLDLSMPVERVHTWPEAVDHCADLDWENVQLDAQNQLTLWLHHHDRDNYQKWNDIVDRHKSDVVDPLTRELLAPFQQQNGLSDVVVHSVQSDILGALMENSYLGSGHRSFFSLELLAVYEAGHFPCGWDGTWPQGMLLVY